VAMARGTVTVQTIPAWDTGLMVMFRLNGDVSSENLTAIGPLLAQLLDGQVTPIPDGLHIDGVMEGDDARDVNRRLLSALRRAERRTRLRAEWTADGSTYRFFDYAFKSERPA
jgi:hypothetical protein